MGTEHLVQMYFYMIEMYACMIRKTNHTKLRAAFSRSPGSWVSLLSVFHFKTFTNVAFQWKWIPNPLQQLLFYSVRCSLDAVSFEFNAFPATWNSLDFTQKPRRFSRAAPAPFIAVTKNRFSNRFGNWYIALKFWFRAWNDRLTSGKLKTREKRLFPMLPEIFE